MKAFLKNLPPLLKYIVLALLILFGVYAVAYMFGYSAALVQDLFG